MRKQVTRKETLQEKEEEEEEKDEERKYNKAIERTRLQRLPFGHPSQILATPPVLVIP